MRPTIPDTALLLFSRSAGADAMAKRLLPARRTDKRIFSAFIHRSRCLASAAGLPLFHIDETRQRGETFGQRLANAVQDVFDKGFQKIIVIGNDCPGLSSTLIVEAASALQQNDFVLGPDQRGGVYLLGIDKAAFCKEAVAAINWQSATVRDELVQLSNSDTSYLLPLLQDVNTLQDLQKAVQRLTNGCLRRFIISLLSSVHRLPFFHLPRVIANGFLRSSGLRAPPVA